MQQKFAFTDDGFIKRIPGEIVEGDAASATRSLAEAAAGLLGNDVLFTLDKAALKKLRKNIDEVLGEDESLEAIAHMKDLSLADAVWWFTENVPEDSPARSACFFALRTRRANEAN